MLSCHLCLSMSWLIPHFPHEALGPLEPLTFISSYALPFAPVVSATLASSSLTMPDRQLPQGICTWCFPSLGSSSAVAHMACFLTSFISLPKCHLPVRPSLLSLFKTDPPLRHTVYPHFLLYFLYNMEHHLTSLIWFISCLHLSRM